MKPSSLLEKYLAGTLSEEETNEFNNLRESNSDFDVEVTFHEDLSLITLEEERVRLKSLLIEQSSAPWKRNKIVLTILATLLVMSAVFVYLYFEKSNSSQSMYASYFEPYPNTFRPVSRNVVHDIVTQAFTAYESANYELASQKFEQALIENRDPTIIFYQGICFSAMGDSGSAISNFKEIEFLEFPYSIEIHWYLGLEYVNQSDRELAIQSFQNYLDREVDKERRQRALDIIEDIQ